MEDVPTRVHLQTSLFLKIKSQISQCVNDIFTLDLLFYVFINCKKYSSKKYRTIFYYVACSIFLLVGDTIILLHTETTYDSTRTIPYHHCVKERENLLCHCLLIFKKRLLECLNYDFFQENIK
jgi:hypothetical protein